MSIDRDRWPGNFFEDDDDLGMSPGDDGSEDHDDFEDAYDEEY